MTSAPLFEFVEGRGCPACTAHDFSEVHQTRYPDHPGLFRIIECGRCGLLLNSPRLHDPGVLYASSYYVFAETEAARQSTAFTQLHWVRELCDEDLSGLRILEVGPALGHLAHLLMRCGAIVQAVELSDHAVAESRERFGVDVRCGSIEDFASDHPTERFDAVLAFEVLEHVTDPLSFVDACRKLLRPGGVLCLSTPNAGASGRYRRRTSWGGFNPFHIVLFTAASVQELLVRSGFRELRVESTRASDTSTPLTRLPGALRRIAVDACDTLGLGRLARALRARLAGRPQPSTDIEAIPVEDGLARNHLAFSADHCLGDTLRIRARR